MFNRWLSVKVTMYIPDSVMQCKNFFVFLSLKIAYFNETVLSDVTNQVKGYICI